MDLSKKCSDRNENANSEKQSESNSCEANILAANSSSPQVEERSNTPLETVVELQQLLPSSTEIVENVREFVRRYESATIIENETGQRNMTDNDDEDVLKYGKSSEDEDNIVIHEMPCCSTSVDVASCQPKESVAKEDTVSNDLVDRFQRIMEMFENFSRNLDSLEPPSTEIPNTSNDQLKSNGNFAKAQSDAIVEECLKWPLTSHSPKTVPLVDVATTVSGLNLVQSPKMLSVSSQTANFETDDQLKTVEQKELKLQLRAQLWSVIKSTDPLICQKFSKDNISANLQTKVETEESSSETKTLHEYDQEAIGLTPTNSASETSNAIESNLDNAINVDTFSKELDASANTELNEVVVINLEPLTCTTAEHQKPLSIDTPAKLLSTQKHEVVEPIFEPLISTTKMNELNVPSIDMVPPCERTYHTIHIDTTSSPSSSVMRRPPLCRRCWSIISNLFHTICMCLQINKDCLFCIGFFIAFVVSASFLTAFFYRTLSVSPKYIHTHYPIDGKQLDTPQSKYLESIKSSGYMQGDSQLFYNVGR